MAEGDLTSRTFLHGPAGCGKTAVGVERLRHLIAERIPASSILVLTPQRTLHDPYLLLARSSAWGNGSGMEAFTVGGLAHRLCDLFWPLVAESAGFANPARPPYFLTLESSQYYMSHLVRPLLDLGYFRSVTMDRNRLYAQILDSLNKSAAVGFPYTEIGARLDAAWVGDVAQRRIYLEAQDCATRFREYCLRHNLLDFSLQMEVFWNHLWPAPIVREYLNRSFRHLIYDNVEEDVPRAHDLIQQWLPEMDSALLIYDEQGGYRGFLGADTGSGWELRRLCSSDATLRDSFVMSMPLRTAEADLEAAIRDPRPEAPGRRKSPTQPPSTTAVRFLHGKFFPEMLDSVCKMIHSLTVAENVAPSEIAILGPYLSDALRFALIIRLEALAVPVRTHRPSRSLRDEPSAAAMLTLAALAHPHWNAPPAPFDVARLFLTVLGMDLVRAHLLAEIVFRRGFTLLPLDDLDPDAQERITPDFGARYSRLREWLLDYRLGQPQPLDHFFRRIFGEVLSQPGFGFHEGIDEARVVGNLVESVTKFRLAMEPSLVDTDHADFDVGMEYMRMLQEGVLASQYLESWKQATESAVLIAPAYSFLMMNRAVAYQFWLDPGSSGWFERLDQPLTHTRVLSRSWPRDKRWDLAEEERENLDAMARMTNGLLRRCSRQVFACTSQVGESGFEQRGPFLRALQQVFHESEILQAE
ncbi:MAG TPA: hypothetical protein VFH29_05180 [Anaerolineales bacterium]|nr:hypothetical protein [Anaerolineales bacterium]